ncbi:6368_t:CDS:2, partial [Acaulospora colombiana]
HCLAESQCLATHRVSTVSVSQASSTPTIAYPRTTYAITRILSELSPNKRKREDPSSETGTKRLKLDHEDLGEKASKLSSVEGRAVLSKRQGLRGILTRNQSYEQVELRMIQRKTKMRGTCPQEARPLHGERIISPPYQASLLHLYDDAMLKTGTSQRGYLSCIQEALTILQGQEDVRVEETGKEWAEEQPTTWCLPSFPPIQIQCVARKHYR